MISLDTVARSVLEWSYNNIRPQESGRQDHGYLHKPRTGRQ